MGSWQVAASAISTTDTYPKGSACETQLGDTRVNIAGIAKGSGMIAPNMATMLAFENGRCTGLTYRRGNCDFTVHARESVILSAGALASPKLLMANGIGGAAELKAKGIPVLWDSPNVGKNLREHPEGMVSIEVNQSTFNTEINSWKILLHSINWLLFGRGPATSPYPHAVAFLKSDPALNHADIQVQLGPYAFSFDKNGVIPHDRPAISAAVNIAYPRSYGEVRLRSNNPLDTPIIDHQLLGDEDDVSRLIVGCEAVRSVLKGEAFTSHRVAEHLPGKDVQSRDEWTEYLRKTAFLGYHPVGTCQMGSNESSVVDPELRVRGVEGLRVADASIMPDLISGNTNATAIMIGEKAADLITGRTS